MLMLILVLLVSASLAADVYASTTGITGHLLYLLFVLCSWCVNLWTILCLVVLSDVQWKHLMRCLWRAETKQMYFQVVLKQLWSCSRMTQIVSQWISHCGISSSRFTIWVHTCPLSRVNAEACLDLAQCLNPRVGQVSQYCAAPVDGACMNVCCTKLLSNGLVSSTCTLRQARLIDRRGRACRPNVKGTEEEGVLSDVVPELSILSGFGVGVSLDI